MKLTLRIVVAVLLALVALAVFGSRLAALSPEDVLNLCRFSTTFMIASVAWRLSGLMFGTRSKEDPGAAENLSISGRDYR